MSSSRRADGANRAIFAEGFSDRPYWWDRTPRPDLPIGPLPARADAVVVGAGYTGLHAALQLARAGRDVLLLDAADAGWGCSTRNGGQVGDSIKPGFAALSRRYGPETAAGLVGTGFDALAWLGQFVRAERIDCDFRVCGRFHAAHSPAAFRRLVGALSDHPPGMKEAAHVVTAADQRQELGTNAYHGGVVFRDHAALDPAAYHAGLLQRVAEAGGRVLPHTAATGIGRDGDGFMVETLRGSVRAGAVALATNGYTDGVSPWLRRRVIPIGSYIIATEPLPAGVVDRLMPRDRVVSDTRKVVYYYRASPDRTRILFGGRVSVSETDPRRSAPRLRAEMVRLFPELEGVRISHSWMGFVAYSFDELPHIGEHEGVHHAGGYCGSGVSMASYLGMRLGQRMLGLAEGRTALDRLSFETRPLYHGRPWFLGPALLYYRLRDRLGV